MSVSRRQFARGAALAAAAMLSACGSGEQDVADSVGAASPAEDVQEEPYSDLTFDSSAWRYNEEDDVFYQLGVPYCETPASEEYERLAILVPGAYLQATSNGDGTYTCVTNARATMGDLVCKDAPIVMPVSTPGYEPQAPMSEYVSQAAFTNAGLVYVHAGCRGLKAGAPASVVDIKAAIRFLHYVKDQIAGDPNRIFVCGLGEGGGLASVLGATGASELYEPYLEALGAVHNENDTVCGVMAWCPVTGLDSADEAYEWMMRDVRTELTAEEEALSTRMAEAYVTWLRAAGLEDNNGATLMLSSSWGGVYQAGSYYDYVLRTIENSLNYFLDHTTFPYHVPQGDGATDDEYGEGGSSTTGTRFADHSEDADTQTTFYTVEDYIAALNAEVTWVTYDKVTHWVTVTSLADFCRALKPATRGFGAYDQLDRGQTENELFGIGGEPSHFDVLMGTVLDGLGNPYASDYLGDVTRTDELGMDVVTRVNMYSPLYFALASSEGFVSTALAKHWRVRTGAEQTEVPLTSELNLVLALNASSQVVSVDYAMVWGQGYGQAEWDGSATENLIAWIYECLEY